MSFYKLYLSPKTPFGGYSRAFEDSEFIIVGVPYDLTSTYRASSRFAPAAIREASLNIESYSWRAGVDADELPIGDLGDLDIVADFGETVQRLSKIVSEVLGEGKRIALLGGEHSIAYAPLKSLPSGTAAVVADAHLDARDEYLGSKWSHATFMRRLLEEEVAEKVVFVGVRAVSKEELDFVKNNRVCELIDALSILRGRTSLIDEVSRITRGFSKVYLSIDLDVFDPSYAPGVANPEPEGLSPTHIIDLVHAIGSRLIGVDVVECAPSFDNGVTSILAAKLVYEAACAALSPSSSEES